MVGEQKNLSILSRKKPEKNNLKKMIESFMFWMMMTVPEGPPFLVYQKKRGYVLESIGGIEFYRMPLFLYLSYFVLGLIIYYWRLQLENDAVEITTVEWETSMVVLCVFISQASRSYLTARFINQSRGKKARIIPRLKIVLGVIFFLCVYLLTSVFGLYHSFTDHHPVFAWAMFSCYLFFLFVIIQQDDLNIY